MTCAAKYTRTTMDENPAEDTLLRGQGIHLLVATQSFIIIQKLY